MGRLADEKLREWAREHLVYESRMLVYAAVTLANRGDVARDPESNALLESFAVHVRCLDGFLWGRRDKRYPMDALAADFCESGVWARERGARPRALAELLARNRAGREVVHLSYERLNVEPVAKDWPVGEIVEEIAHLLLDFTLHALPSRLDDETRAALQEPLDHTTNVGPASVATGALLEYRGGTIPFPNLHGS